MMSRHGSVTMSIDGRHGLVITAVMVEKFLANFAVGQRSRSHFRWDLHQT